MKKIFFLGWVMAISCNLFAQKTDTDTTKMVKLNEVIIVSGRIPILLIKNPGAVSLVTTNDLVPMPKGIAADEALRLVPGVRIDNQHTGERIHLSIRGQGILTERGLRGIGVTLDGIPLNDPSGFAPDLYDVDWNTVQFMEVLRGPAASLYGGGAAAGLLNITTEDGGNELISGKIGLSWGSNAFSNSSLQFNGKVKNVDYRVSYSYTSGDGYRDHQAFWGNKLYEKINFHPSEKLKITQVFSWAEYFHQNPEGLSLSQLDKPTQANPDARPFNEYQKTNRNSYALLGNYTFSKKMDFQINGFYRNTLYKETSNACAEYRTISSQGTSMQLNYHFGNEKIKHHFSIGVDARWQSTNMHKLESVDNPDRPEGTDETNLVNSNLLALQKIHQNSTGLFGLYKLELGKFNVVASVRADQMKNTLDNLLYGGDTATTKKDYAKTSLRLGLSYMLLNNLSFFADVSQGFLPPSTEELASNPTGYSGFNTHLVPATSTSYEAGFRGLNHEKLFYELTGFYMKTENDFFRFKQSGRGNQEVFYGNAGNSNRAGVELFLSYKVCQHLKLQLAYTYSNYQYSSATVDPVYTNSTYVLTTPAASGQFLPNSPEHQWYAEALFNIDQHWSFSLSSEYQSKWAIYTDAHAYNGELDPSVYQNWQKGFNLWHARLAYAFDLEGLKGECSLTAKNFSNQKYMAFTEPDPDGNSYQPGPGSEYFINLKIKF